MGGVSNSIDYLPRVSSGHLSVSAAV
jgi:hypothetical protein